ncbi:MAG: AAA family ATPase [Candidatus Omnitrophica bacterium]|nr:AAA family ATPase [Candidatus Omnitrophota bacterium]
MAWDDILGHELVKRLWQAHLRDGRVAPAYLLVGPEGIGKRRLAVEMAKALNCAADGIIPCDRCQSCRLISRQSHPDVHLLSPQGASAQIPLDAVQQVLGRLALRPYSGKAQVAIVDGADRLTEEAANCLLKALEEPPGAAKFLLLTSQLPHCLATIVSRCQIIRCRPPSRGPAGRSEAAMAPWAGEPSAWLSWPLPESRSDVTEWLDAMIVRLRDLAVAGAGPAPERCVDAAFELLLLRESVEQFVSPRLVASLARERWLSLHEKQGGSSG